MYLNLNKIKYSFEQDCVTILLNQFKLWIEYITKYSISLVFLQIILKYHLKANW